MWYDGDTCWDISKNVVLTVYLNGILGGCPIEQWLRLKLPGYFRIVGIHGLGIAPSLVAEWPTGPRSPSVLRCITQPGHAKELFFNKGVQGFGGAVRSL